MYNDVYPPLGGGSVKNSPANAGDIRGESSIPGSWRSPGEGNGNPLRYLAWKIPWTEESGEQQCIESQSRTRLKRFSTHRYGIIQDGFTALEILCATAIYPPSSLQASGTLVCLHGFAFSRISFGWNTIRASLWVLSTQNHEINNDLLVKRIFRFF